MKSAPEFFETIRQRAESRWLQLEADPDLAGPWHQLFKQVQSPRHVLSELLQNADDAGATEASIEISDNKLIFEHNGEDFTEEHFASLCRFGYSNKRSLHTIGFRGIGFKSTFSLGDPVELHSPTLSVAFDRDRFTAPRWLKRGDSDLRKTSIRVNILDHNRKRDLEKNIEEWMQSPVSLLFFRSIRRLRVGNHNLSWNRVDGGPVDGSEWMQLDGSDEEKYLIIRSGEEEFPDDALDEIRQERLLTPDQEAEFPPCKVEIVLGAAGRLFVVLPTGVETVLPFACNAPFIQDPSRLKIKDPSMSPTNRWLLKRTGRLASSAMLQWLKDVTLSVADRSRAYGLFPDVDLEDNSLEGNCASQVESTFVEDIQDQAFLLAKDGELRFSEECVLYPTELFDTWSSDEIIAQFDGEKRPPFAMEVIYGDRLKLIKQGMLTEIEMVRIAEVLETSHLPKPETWERLLSLWSFLAPEITKFWYRRNVGSLNIVPTQGKEVLCSANEVVRIGENRLLQSDEDWKFLSQHLLVVNQNWTRYLAEQRRESIASNDHPRREIVESAFLVLKYLGLDDTSSISEIIDRVADRFFRSDGISLAGSTRFTQIAAKLDAKVGESFRYVTRDRFLKSNSVVVDTDGYLDLLFDAEWSEGHLLHADYTNELRHCSKDEWNKWIESGRSGLTRFVPLRLLRQNVYGRDKIRTELRRRGYAGDPYFQYVTHEFLVEDWDFETQHWDTWKKLAEEDDNFWGQLLERVLDQPTKYWSEAKAAKIVQIATTGSRQAITQASLLPGWILTFRELNCLRDTHGAYRKPADLLCRTPATESVIDVEPFVQGSIDVEANRPLLKLLGVREVPTGPGHLLDRLRAMAKAENPPIHEVEKWYRRLDIMWNACSTDDATNIRSAFKDEKVIYTERGTWTTSSGVFLASDEVDVPGADLIRSSVADLTIWSKIGIASHPTADLAIAWLNELDSDLRLSQDDIRRVRALQKRYPYRIWNECAHWSNLAGEWVMVENLSYSLTMQFLVGWSHLHEWVKQKTADLQNLGAEITGEPPFSGLLSLASQIENRLNDRLFNRERAEVKPWLRQLGSELSRVEFDDQVETVKVRILGERLSRSNWQIVEALETIPYIDGVPAGMPIRTEAVWLEESIYVENRPLSKLAGSVAKAIGSVFDNPKVIDAIKLCFDRPPKFITEYMEENFKLVAESRYELDRNADQTSEVLDPDTRESLDEDLSVPAGPIQTSAGDLEDNECDLAEEEWDANDESDDEDSNYDEDIIKVPRNPKPSIVERFAISLGFNKDNERRFFHPDGSWIAKTDDALFPWERRSASGVLLRYYWPKDHCLENKPIIIETESWRMIDKYPDRYSLILVDNHGDPTEMTGTNLVKLHGDGAIRLYPATYRITLG